jgi:hypothetical protein
MSRVEIVKNGKKLGEIDDLAGTIKTTEEWDTILKSRREIPVEEDEEDDGDGRGRKEGKPAAVAAEGGSR